MSLEEVLKGATSADAKTQETLASLRELYAKKLWFEFQERLEELVLVHRAYDSSALVEKTLQELQINLDPFVLLRLYDESLERRATEPQRAL